MPDSILTITETISPVDQPAAQEALAAALASGTVVYPLGAGTMLGRGANCDRQGGPLPSGLGLSTAKLNRVIDHADRDLTITVEAGVTVAKLAKLLASKKQRLPVDIRNPDQTTIGGAVAVGGGGPRRFRCGTMRDYVIGFSAVDGAGQAFAGGGRVVKNAAGYDMCRLMTGSLGTLALITQVTLMVKPLPAESAFLACDLPDFDTAERMLADLVRSETLPAAVELLAGSAWREDPALGPLDDRAARLLVGFEGSQVDVEWMLDTLGRQWQQALGQAPTVVKKSHVASLWDRLAQFPADIGDNQQSRPLAVQIATLPSSLVDLVQQIQKLYPQVSIQAHAGDGILRARFPIDPDAITPFMQEKLRPTVSAAGARMTVLDYPPQAKLDQRTVWGPPGDGIDVMQAIKNRFDPKGLLNPGRFVF